MKTMMKKLLLLTACASILAFSQPSFAGCKNFLKAYQGIQKDLDKTVKKIKKLGKKKSLSESETQKMQALMTNGSVDLKLLDASHEKVVKCMEEVHQQVSEGYAAAGL